ncbi:MAG: ABC transporter ATP-binding protein [Oxalobacteraceae bacterium]|jgi:branched-chain amino acid transport system ATP-binding protein|nr:ABC transporter ATP-binding protein [Oxalobacteraceae bacterium]
MNAPVSTLLSIRNLTVSFGGIEAVKGIDLDVQAGELVTLIGANGAGKTTTLKAITNTLAASNLGGDITYMGQRIDRMPAHKLPGLGLVMVPEGRGVFSRMSIRENLLMGGYLRDDQQAIEADIDHWFGIFPRLKEREDQLAGNLSGGEQQMLAMARALMGHPKLLLLDEPSMGLAPLMVARIFDVIRQVANQGITIFLVEQNVRQALSVATRGYVMDSGRIVLNDTAANLLQDTRVVEAYLGG